MRKSVDAARDLYINSVFVQEDAPLREVFSTLREDESHMQVSPIEGKILQTFVKMIGAKKIIELGVLAGYSSIWMARALPENGKLYSLEMDYKKEPRIRSNLAKCGVADKVEFIRGKALDILPTLEQHGPFDMIFIDADKINYLNYLNWAEQHVRKGGLIVGDNTFLFGSVYGDYSDYDKAETIKIMQEFNRRLSDSTKYTSIILPTIEGMTVAVKNY